MANGSSSVNWASNDDDNDARPTTNLSTRPLQLQDSLSSTASRPSSSASRALTPAQQYRETLRAMTPAEHVLRRLAWRWEKDIDTWRAGTVKIQRLQRGIASRSFSDVLKAQKQAMYSVVKITLKAGGDVTMGKADDAIFSLSRALHVDPGAKLAYLVRGRAYFVQGMYNEAMNDFSSVVMSGTAEESRDDVLRMRIALGDEYHTALTTFDRLKLFSVGTLVDSFHDPQIRAANDMIKVAGFANKGRLNMVQKFYQNAIEDFTEVIESRGLDDGDCDFASMYFFRGLAYCKSHEWYAAVEDFTLNINLTGTDPDAYIRRAHAFSALQDWEAALTDLSTAIELQADPVSYCMRARLLCCMRRFPDAIMDYKRSIAKDKTYAPAIQGLRQAAQEHDPLPLVSQHG